MSSANKSNENIKYIKKKVQINQDDIKLLMKSYTNPEDYFNVEKNIKHSKCEVIYLLIKA